MENKAENLENKVSENPENAVSLEELERARINQMNSYFNPKQRWYSDEKFSEMYERWIKMKKAQEEQSRVGDIGLLSYAKIHGREIIQKIGAKNLADVLIKIPLKRELKGGGVLKYLSRIRGIRNVKEKAVELKDYLVGLVKEDFGEIYGRLFNFLLERDSEDIWKSRAAQTYTMRERERIKEILEGRDEEFSKKESEESLYSVAYDYLGDPEFDMDLLKGNYLRLIGKKIENGNGEFGKKQREILGALASMGLGAEHYISELPKKADDYEDSIAA